MVRTRKFGMVGKLSRAGAGAFIVLLVWLSLTLLASVFVTEARAEVAAPAPGYRLQRVVVVMRHGIRPPTKAQVIPAELTTRDWPSWDVPFGHLTSHGEKAIAVLGAYDRLRYSDLLAGDCSRKLRVIADTDQRTLKTAEVYAQALGECPVTLERVEGETPDARFSQFEVPPIVDTQTALANAQAALPARGLVELDAANRARLDAISAILGCTKTACKLSARPTQFVTPAGRVKIEGGLDTGSTVSQVLMLEYADGKPMDQVGWGLADKARIRDLLSLHALEFQLVARPKAIAEFGARALLDEVRRGLFATDQAPITVLVGHDSNLAYLGGALGLHWQGGDFPRDDPPPGGAIIFEKWSNAKGAETIVIRFRAQTLDELRNLTVPGEGAVTTLKAAICAQRAVCEGRAFNSALDRLVAP